MVAVIALVAVGSLPTTGETMIDFVPRTVTQPLYVKALGFVLRDAEMRDLSARVVGEARAPEEKAERILRWANANVRPTPAGMPVVDDHPYNIVVRGYGQADQAADVFANVAAYAGMPGGVVFSRRPDGRNYYAFAMVRIGDGDVIFDVREGRSFRDRSGRLATVAQLRADPSLLDGLPPPAAANGVPYPVLIAALDSGPHRRATQQMVLWRILDELGRRIPHWW